jgi:hypothetical protein
MKHLRGYTTLGSSPRAISACVLAMFLMAMLWNVADAATPAPDSAPNPTSALSAQANPTPTPDPKPWYNYFSIQLVPTYTFTIGGSNNSGLFNPESSGLQMNYSFGLNAPAEQVGDNTFVVNSAQYSRTYGNSVASSVGRNLLGAFNVHNINSITEQFNYQAMVNDATGLTYFVFQAGSQYNHASCCSSTPFNPESVFHSAYFSVDDFFGPVVSRYAPTRALDILVQYNSGPHVASDSYLDTLASQGVADAGASRLWSFQGRVQFPVDHNAGKTMVYAMYFHTEARYDNTPQSIFTNDYTFGVTHVFAWWVAADLHFNSFTHNNYEQAFATPTITGNTAMNLDLILTPLPTP